jgi:hypothetical protein
LITPASAADASVANTTSDRRMRVIMVLILTSANQEHKNFRPDRTKKLNN